MNVIVLADRLGHELGQLTHDRPVALLPVAGKPLVQYTLEDLALAGIREVHLAISSQAECIEATLGDGTRWGLRLHYALTRGEEPASAVIRRLGLAGQPQLLVMRGDVLRCATAAGLLKDRAVPKASAAVWQRGAAGAVLCAGEDPTLANFGWPLAQSPAATSHRHDGWLPLDRFNPIDSVAAYHRANLEVTAGRFDGILREGREAAPGLRMGPRARAAPAQIETGQVYVGAEAQLAPSVRCAGRVVIGDGALIDRDVSIRDSVVLPHTYVGPGLDIRNAIVAPDRLVRVDTGAELPIADDFVLASMARRELAASAQALGNRLAGVLALALSLPLWPLAVLAAVVHAPGDPLRSTRLCGNRGRLREASVGTTFDAWEWNTPHWLLRWLPRLFALVRGDLDLVGIAPLPPVQHQERAALGWGAERAPAGLINPAAIDLPPDAPDEEIRLHEACYAVRRSTWLNARYVLAGLMRLYRPGGNQGGPWRAPHGVNQDAQ